MPLKRSPIVTKMHEVWTAKEEEEENDEADSTASTINNIESRSASSNNSADELDDENFDHKIGDTTGSSGGGKNRSKVKKCLNRIKDEDGKEKLTDRTKRKSVPPVVSQSKGSKQWRKSATNRTAKPAARHSKKAASDDGNLSEKLKMMIKNLDEAFDRYGFDNYAIQNAFGNRLESTMMKHNNDLHFWCAFIDAMIERLGKSKPGRMEAAASWILYEIGSRITHENTIITLPAIDQFCDAIEPFYPNLPDPTVGNDDRTLTNKIITLTVFSYLYADEMVAHLVRTRPHLLSFAIKIISRSATPASDLMQFFALLHINRCLMAIDAVTRQDAETLHETHAKIDEYRRQLDGMAGNELKLRRRLGNLFYETELDELFKKRETILHRLKPWREVMKYVAAEQCEMHLERLCQDFDAGIPDFADHVRTMEEARAVNRKAAAQMILYRIRQPPPRFYYTPPGVGFDTSCFRRDRPQTSACDATPNLGIINVSHGYWACGSHFMYTTYQSPRGTRFDRVPQIFAPFVEPDSDDQQQEQPIGGGGESKAKPSGLSRSTICNAKVTSTSGFYFEVKVLTLASIRVGICEGGVDADGFEGSDMYGCKGSICIDPLLCVVLVNNTKDDQLDGYYRLPAIKEGDIIGCFFRITRSPRRSMWDVLDACEFCVNGKRLDDEFRKSSSSSPLFATQSLQDAKNLFQLQLQLKKKRKKISTTKTAAGGGGGRSSSKCVIASLDPHEPYHASFSVSAFNCASLLPSREYWRHRPVDRLTFEVPDIVPPVRPYPPRVQLDYGWASLTPNSATASPSTATTQAPTNLTLNPNTVTSDTSIIGESMHDERGGGARKGKRSKMS